MRSTSSDKLAVKAIRLEVFDLCSSNRNVNGLNLTHLEVGKIQSVIMMLTNIIGIWLTKKWPEDGKEPCKLDKIFQKFTEEIEFFLGQSLAFSLHFFSKYIGMRKYRF